MDRLDACGISVMFNVVGELVSSVSILLSPIHLILVHKALFNPDLYSPVLASMSCEFSVPLSEFITLLTML